MFYLKENNIIDIRKEQTKKIVLEAQNYIDPLITYINSLSDEDREILKKAYGAPGENKYWRTFQKVIRETHAEFNPDGLDQYIAKQEKEYNDRAFSIIRELETYFKNDFKIRLEDKYGKMWFKKGVPPQIGDDAVALATKKNRERINC